MKTTTLQLVRDVSPAPDELGSPVEPGYEVCSADPRGLCEVFKNAEYVGLGPTQSLRLFSEPEFRKLREDYDKAPPERQRVYRPMLARMVRLELQEEGRLVLPRLLCVYAGLREGQAVLAEADDGSMFLCAPEYLGELKEMLRR